MDIENLKISSRLKNKTWSNSQIKNHENSCEFRLIRAQTGHRNPEHIYLRIFTTLLQSMEKIVNPHVFKSVYKAKKHKNTIQANPLLTTVTFIILIFMLPAEMRARKFDSSHM
jgi:hypothetical protein